MIFTICSRQDVTLYNEQASGHNVRMKILIIIECYNLTFDSKHGMFFATNSSTLNPVGGAKNILREHMV